MPCQGTDGKVLEQGDRRPRPRRPAHRRGPAQRPEGHPARGQERRDGARLGRRPSNLGDGALVIDAVVGQANVTRTADGKVTSDTKGTRSGRSPRTASRRSSRTPGARDPGRGQDRAEDRREDAKSGISVVALRITLLDGTGAVIDLGVAKAHIR